MAEPAVLKKGTQLQGEMEKLRLLGEIFSNALKGKQTKQQLKETQINYRALADFSYDWAYWENPDESLRYVSPSCEGITGYASPCNYSGNKKEIIYDKYNITPNPLSCRI